LDYFKKVAFGILRIPKSDWLIMTPYEVSLAHEGYLEQENRHSDEFWYGMRRISYDLYCNSFMFSKSKPKEIDTYWPDWNKKSKVPSKKEDRLKLYEKING